MRSSRSNPAPLLAAALLLSLSPGCGPSQVANDPVHYDLGALEEVGQLYLGAANIKKKPPTSLKDLARNRDNFLIGYQALEKGEIVVYWGVEPTPGDESGTTEEILAYQAGVPTEGGPVLLKDLTIQTVTAEEFQAAPKPAGPTSANGADKAP